MKGLFAGTAVLAAFAMAATIALAASLGRADAAAQLAAQGPPVLSVYAPMDAGTPKLEDKTITGWRALEGVRAAVAVRELPVTLGGLGYALAATVYAVPEEELKYLNIPLAQGELPHSAWNVQALLGSALAQHLAEAANRADGTPPGAVRLSVEGGATLDVQLGSMAAPTGTARDDGLWLDEAIARALLLGGNDSQDAKPLPITRAEVEARSVSAAWAVAQALHDQGYLVKNPAEAAARTLTEGAATARQWGWLSALLGIAAAMALWRQPPQRALTGAMIALTAALAGMAAAAVLMQTAALLGWRFFLSTDARYLLNAPRLLAVPALAVALALVMGLLPRHSQSVRQA